MKYRFQDATAVRTLRRLLAALPPSSNTDMSSDKPPEDVEAALAVDDMDTAEDTNGQASIGGEEPSTSQSQSSGNVDCSGSDALEGSDAQTSSATDRSNPGDEPWMAATKGNGGASSDLPSSTPDSSDSEDGYYRSSDSNSNSRASNSSDSELQSTSSSSGLSTDMPSSQMEDGSYTEEAAGDNDLGCQNLYAAQEAWGLLQLLVQHSAFVPSMLGADNKEPCAAAAPPLPPHVDKLLTPLGSLMPLLDPYVVPQLDLSVGKAAQAPSHPGASTIGLWGAAGVGFAGLQQAGKAKLLSGDPCAFVSADSGLASSASFAIKAELAALIETLLDACRQFAGQWAQHTFEGDGREMLCALLQLSLTGYHATCHPTDRSVLRLLWLLDATMSGNQGREMLPAAVLAGPISRLGFLHGPAAAELFQRYPNLLVQLGGAQPQPHPSNNGHIFVVSDSKDEKSVLREEVRQYRSRLLREQYAPDGRRAGLACVHFPQHHTLTADEEELPTACEAAAARILDQRNRIVDGALIAAAESGAAASAPAVRSLAFPPASFHPASYDPAYMLPFAAQCLRDGVIDPATFTRWGLLSLCLRGLAAPDDALRAVAYETLGLFTVALAAADFREKSQLEALLLHCRNAVIQPFQQLPTPGTMFLAEATLVLLQPESQVRSGIVYR